MSQSILVWISLFHKQTMLFVHTRTNLASYNVHKRTNQQMNWFVHEPTNKLGFKYFQMLCVVIFKKKW